MPNLITPEFLALVAKYKRQSIITDDNHWLFKGVKNKHSGHGVITYQNKNRYLHRLIFCIINNLDYKDQTFYVCHKNECNIANCWNPDHMYKGTATDNANDAVTLKTHVESRKTHCPRGHEYRTQGKVLSNGKRKCMECSRLRDRNRKRYTDANGHRHTVPGTRKL